MIDHNKFIEAAHAIALAAPGVGGKHHNRFRLGCVIVNEKNKIVSARFNCLKTHPKLVNYFKWPYCHAEAYAILSLGFDNCQNKSLYVVRIYRDNTLALAKPCDGCYNLAKFVGIKHIFYSVEKGYKQLCL